MSFAGFPGRLFRHRAERTEMRFRTTLLSAGKTATGIHIPDEIIAGLGSSRKPAVKVTINGYTYRSTVASRGDRFLVGVSAENRAGAGVAAGDEIDVEIELETEARRFFDGLSYSKQSWFVGSVESAKSPETRQRRIDKAVELLREGRAR